MKYNPNIHHRKSIRLKGYDYAQAGLYFITICTQNRECLFGNIINGEMILNDAGNIANECWLAIPNHFPNVVLHEFVIMPNHIHGIIELKTKSVGAENFPPHISMGANDSMGVNDSIGANDSVRAENFPPHISMGVNDSIGANDSVRAENFPPHISIGANDSIGANHHSPLRSPSKTIGSMVRGYKIGVTKWMRQNTDVYDVWQRNYWEHIIRNENEYNRIAEYIINNPQNWGNDTLKSQHGTVQNHSRIE